jgi:cyclic-di-AMP phosphodiesterase PgpH
VSFALASLLPPMFNQLRQTQLQREGLCGRTRRKHQDDSVTECLRSHPVVTGIIMAGFVVAILVMLQLAGGLPGVVRPGALDMLYATVLASAALVHLHIGHQYLKADNRHVLLVLGILVVHLAAVLGTARFALQQGWSGGVLVTVLPHAIAPLMLGVLMGQRLGLFATIHGSMIGAVICLPANRLTFLAAAVMVGSLAVLSTRKVRRRTTLFFAGCWVGVGASVFSILLMVAETGDNHHSWLHIAAWPLITGVLTGMAVGGVLPVLESIFGVTTDITWLELADLNHPLMRRMSMEAPGTYHHSLMVANLAEAAAEAIGASATMCRVCSYFHDIGKLNKPEYFIENMDPGENPHKDLTARMSALVLMAHVKDGVDLALQHKLNCRIVDVIEQHHGTSLAWFFYRRALDQKAEMLKLVEQDKAKEDEVPEVHEEVFRYQGPRPQFRESAIISLADAVESTSRTLEKPNASRVETMVDEIVMNRLMDEQLDECDLTIADLAKVKASFVKSLLSMMHSRIKYQARTQSEDVTEEVAEGKVVSIEMGRLPATGPLGGDATRRRKRPGRPA